MSLQDSVYSYNLTVDETKKIHIHIAANRGEIRVAENDIFGEPINISSRIETITPADEIYLSESLYTSINKDKVPAQEVGLKEISGETTRIYNIPRYLMPQLASPAHEQGTLYPYGGMHYLAPQGKSLAVIEFVKNSPFKWAFIATPILIVSIITGLTLYTPSTSSTPDTSNTAISTGPNPYLGEISDQPTDGLAESAQEVLNNILSSRPKLPEPIAKVERKKSYRSKKSTSRRRGNWNITTAKSAYRANQLTRAGYKKIVYDLKINYKNKVRRLKTDYGNKKITKSQYKQAVYRAKLKLKGG